MVSVAATQSETHEQLTAGLTAEDGGRVLDALAYVESMYHDKVVVTGQDVFEFSRGVATTLASINTDVDTRIAGLLFELPVLDPTELVDDMRCLCYL